MDNDDRRWPAMLVGACITIAAIGLALAHILSPGTAIDGTTLTLVGVAVLPWLGSVFKSIELPGGVKAEYRERLAKVEKKVAEVERAFIYGASDPVMSRLGRAVTDFSQYLDRIGLSTAGEKPEIDLGHVPKGYLSAYDVKANKIGVDPSLSDEPGWALHEYAHVALLRAGIYFEQDGELSAIENGLAAYLVCSFMDSPHMGMNDARARALERDQFWLDRDDHTRDLPKASKRHLYALQRGLIWGQVLWQTRGTSQRRQEFDTAIADAWRSATAIDGAKEDTFIYFLIDTLHRAGLNQHAKTFTDLTAKRGLVQ
ncbi:hypothetical protein ABT174_39680 [Streptomyces sparsogenes]|uniref:hypothetical protein n=1 Tax=Streptomyces sparsogenes TaxID=67365 RepID=UPI0033342486